MSESIRRFENVWKWSLCLVFMSICSYTSATDKLITTEHLIDHISIDGFYTRQNIDPKVSLYVREVVADGGIESAAEAGKVIVLVHGATFPATVSFDLQFENASMMHELAKTGWDVFALDLEGYGNSSRPAVMDTPDAYPEEPAPISPETTVADVAAVVDYIRKLRNVDKVHMLGWSAAASIEVPRFAITAPDKLSKIVLYGVADYLEPFTDEENEKYLADADAKKNRMADPATAMDDWAKNGTTANMVLPGLFEVYAPAHLESDPLSVKNDNKVRAPEGRFTPYYTTTSNPNILQAEKITVPTLIIRGEFDTWATLEDNQNLLDALAGDGNELVTIPGGGHYLHMEKVNTQFYAALEKFLSK